MDSNCICLLHLIFSSIQSIQLNYVFIIQDNIFESLLVEDSRFKMLHSQDGHQTDIVNIVTTKKHLKFGNSVTAEWMKSDGFGSISDNMCDQNE